MTNSSVTEKPGPSARRRLSQLETIGAWDVLDGSLAWAHCPVPQPGAEDTLVEVAFAGICGSDLAKLRQAPIPSPAQRWRPGHEIVGWDLGRFRPAPVVVDPLVPCETCRFCTEGDIHLCPDLRRLGWDLPGGFAELVAVPARKTVTLPSADALAAAVLADPLAVAIHGVRCTGLAEGDGRRMAVVGSGAVAICTAAYSRHLGWDVTIVVRTSPKRARLENSVNVTVQTLGETANRAFDAVIDAASGATDEPLTLALDLAQDGGLIVVQTAYQPNVTLTRDLRDIFRRSLAISGSYSYCRRYGQGDFAEAVDMLASSPPWTAPLLDACFPLSSLDEAVRRMATSEAQRPMKAILVSEGMADR